MGELCYDFSYSRKLPNMQKIAQDDFRYYTNSPILIRVNYSKMYIKFSTSNPGFECYIK